MAQSEEVISNSQAPSKASLPKVPPPFIPSSPPSSQNPPVPAIESPTLEQENQTIQLPRQLDLDQSLHHSPGPNGPTITRMPRALSRLQPHNNAGEKELLTSSRPRRRNRVEPDTPMNEQ